MSFVTPAPLLPDILALHGQWRAPETAVVCGDQQWTWAQFMAASHQLAHGLIAIGVQPGDRVGLFMSNGLPMVQAIFGVIAAGGVVVPLNVSVSDDALVSMFTNAQAKIIIASDDFAPRITALTDRLGSSTRYVSVTGGSGWLSFSEVCADQPGSQPQTGITERDLINIIYSSGTTGLPKGITHDHGGRRDWAYDIALALRYHGGARTLLTIGLYSNISWVAMLSTLLAGGTIIVEKSFCEHRFIDSVKAHRVTHTAMVPIQFQRVIDVLPAHTDADLSSMQAMMSCGSPLRETLKRRIFDAFECGIIELYGLTEGIITTLEVEHAEGRWASVGRPLIGTDLCIVDDNDRVLPAGQPGEICSRGRIAMPGYWQRPDANKEVEFIDPKGDLWLRSGDIGYVDTDGFLYIVDRKKDMILSGGQNIYPQDIEAIAVDNEQVFDVAVIGFPSERWGETPVALVVPKPDTRFDAELFKVWLNGRLGRQQKVADVIVTDELPRNPNGKILKRELRATFADRQY